MRFENHSLPPEKRQNKLETKIEPGPEKQIEDVLAAIDNIELEAESTNDPIQLKLLEQRKNYAKAKIGSLFEKINLYMNRISEQKKLKIEKDYYDQKTYLDMLKEVDASRSASHNALISELHSVIRFIANNFAIINKQSIEKWEEDQEERGIPVLRVTRINLSKNILCPDKINLQDRDHIAAWAGDIYHSTGTLRKEPLSKK
ncbi:MAG: hypothetical protein A2Z52_00495 [Candidatus Moranbacteria bacterium RBG_19FT_COMBO_42_6]|nr:MAG: hypothetical protein A2Z52_00495 [Candidatus Moranbacteria bacterium RBG_19FT_COMBO_42_6]